MSNNITKKEAFSAMRALYLAAPDEKRLVDEFRALVGFLNALPDHPLDPAIQILDARYPLISVGRHGFGKALGVLRDKRDTDQQAEPGWDDIPVDTDFWANLDYGKESRCYKYCESRFVVVGHCGDFSKGRLRGLAITRIEE